MVNENLEEIKKLSPEQRIVRLRRFQEKQKQESAEATKIIKDSVAQIKQEEKLKEVIGVPESKKINVAGLFKSEEGLEATIEKEKRELTDEELQEHRQYQTQLSQEPTQEIYQRVKSLYQQGKLGKISYDKMSELDDLSYALDYKQRDMQSGTYKTTGDQIKEMMNASKGLVNYMRKDV